MQLELEDQSSAISEPMSKTLQTTPVSRGRLSVLVQSSSLVLHCFSLLRLVLVSSMVACLVTIEYRPRLIFRVWFKKVKINRFLVRPKFLLNNHIWLNTYLWYTGQNIQWTGCLGRSRRRLAYRKTKPIRTDIKSTLSAHVPECWTQVHVLRGRLWQSTQLFLLIFFFS